VGVICALVVGLLGPTAGIVSASIRSTDAAAPRPALDSVMFGERRITVPSGGHFYGSSFQVMTPDGAHVFVHSSSDLTVAPEDEVLGLGAGMFDLIAGRAVRVPCQGCTSIEGTTTDGSAIVGMSTSQLVPADTDATPDLYLFDEAGPHAISSGIDGLPRFEAMSPTGSFVVFSIRISLHPADTDATEDLYRWNRSTGAVELVSPGALPPTFEALSPDGSRVTFRTGENILGLDLGTTGQDGIYQWTTAAVTLRGRGEFFAASPDGARVYTNTTVALDPLDDDTELDAYLHDATGFDVLSEPSAQAAGLAAVKSDGSAWVIGTAEALTLNDPDTTGDYYLITSSSRNLLSRGTLGVDSILMDAAFSSAIYRTPSALVAADSDEWDDVYRWTATSPEDPRLLSGVGTPAVTPLAYAPDGSRAFMTSSGQHLPEDTDPNFDVYEFADSELRLALPGEQGYESEAWTADLRRLVVSAGALTSDDTNGNISDVYLSDGDLVPPTAAIDGPVLGITGPDPQLTFGTEADDGVWFDCRVDGGAWNPCTSPLQLTGLSEAMHQLDVRAWDAAANSDEETLTWQVDATPPVGTVTVESARTGMTGYTSRTQVVVNMPATDALTFVDRESISNDGVNWTTFYYSGRRSWFLAPGDGTKTVWVRWRDWAGNWSEPETDTIVLDTVAPTATAPNHSFPTGGALSAGALPVKLTWSGGDGGSGIERYELAQQTDSGGYSVTPTSVTSTSHTKTLTPNHTYFFRVRAVDRAGNRSAWMYGSSFILKASSEASGAIKYTGTWATGSSSAYWGGALRYASAAGAKATYTFTGRAVAWVSLKAPNRGKAAIYVNNTYITTVDLYSSTAQFQRVVWSGKWSTSATRTLEIRLLGTPTRPRVDVDGFAFTN
jgi:hypothetical protein